MDDRQYSSDPLDQSEEYAKDQLSFFEDVYDNKDEYKKEEEQNISKPKKEHFSFGRFIVALLVISVVGGAAIGTSFAIATPYVNTYLNKSNQAQGLENKEVKDQTTQAGQDNQNVVKVAPVAMNNSISEIAKNIGPSVVSIKNQRVVETWGGSFTQSGLGSGVIFKEDDSKIYIMTNEHVVEQANTLVVCFLGNTTVEGAIVGMDATTDIAVVSVNKEDIPSETINDIKVAPLGNSDELNVGDLAIAIGTPVDEVYNNTVTVGVISALNRQVSLSDKTLNLIQTDAAINPGNSGGALVGPTGEVVGINTVKLMDVDIEGIGFAIPINDVKEIVNELMVNGKIQRPALGITGKDITSELSDFYELPIGIYVVEVTPGGSAQLAGIQANDIILSFDNTQITSMQQLKELLGKKKVGDTVEIKIARGNTKKVVKVKLREMPQTSIKELLPS